jgi:hypothetical protein
VEQSLATALRATHWLTRRQDHLPTCAAGWTVVQQHVVLVASLSSPFCCIPRTHPCLKAQCLHVLVVVRACTHDIELFVSQVTVILFSATFFSVVIASEIHVWITAAITVLVVIYKPLIWLAVVVFI